MKLADHMLRLVPKACEEVLVSIGCRPTTRVGADVSKLLARPQDYVAGIIDFTGGGVSGDLVVLGKFEFFASSRPAERDVVPLRAQSPGDWIRVRDWTMELTNQVLGRVKNQLCTVGVVLEARLPKAVSGHALQVTVRSRRTSPILCTTTSGHEVFAWFEATYAEGASLDVRVDTLPEGDVVCF